MKMSPMKWMLTLLLLVGGMSVEAKDVWPDGTEMSD